MDEDDGEQRRRKVEAGRAKLAQFRQRKAKGDGAHPKKTTAKRKGTAVTASVPEEEASTVAGSGGAPAPTPGAVQEPNREEELEAAVPRSGREDEDGEQEGPAGSGVLQSQLVQPPSALELEALRLSLNNMHTAQLELTQANLQREKETALVELRDMLNGRHAQELALAQSRQQLELEQAREQHAREREELARRCGQETAELKEKLQSEMERNSQMVENLKQDWESQRELCLANLREELSAKHQLELEDLQDQFRKKLAEQKVELEKIFQAKNKAECALQTLEAQHEAALCQLREDLQVERCQCLEGLELKFREQEQEKQRELQDLRASYEELKAQSQEEIRRLWAQLELAGPGGQEPREPEQPLQAQESCMEELEGLKQDFARRQQQEKAEHESELEQLRLYFEQRLREAERSYQEDLTLLQQRLQEGKVDSPLDAGATSTSLEEASEGEVSRHLQLDPHELEDDHQCSLDAWETSLDVSEGLQLTGSPRCTGEQPAGLSDEPGQGLARVCLRCAQDTALEVEAEVTARVLALETEHKVQLALLQTELKEEMNLLRIENRNLHEKLQHEIGLREDLEKVKDSLIGDHLEELKKAREKHQALKQELTEKEAAWAMASEAQKRNAEEKLTLRLLELRERAESEKQGVVDKFELREAEMRQLQAQQAAQILELEASLLEQQGRLRQLELEATGEEATQCRPCSREPGAGPAAEGGWELAMLRLKEDCALQLIQAQNRFLAERKEMTEKFTLEQDSSLQAAQEQHARELQHLQQTHQQQILALTSELETKHQARLAELQASLESEQQAHFEAHVAELQTKHATEISVLESKHSSNLDALESCCLSEIQSIRDEHRRTLELLRADFEDQLRRKDSAHHASLAQELEKLQRRHDEELRSAQESLGAESSSSRACPASELPAAQQSECESAAKGTLREEKCQRVDSEQTAPPHAEALLSLQPQDDPQMQQLKDQILSLRHDLETRESELEKLRQRRERENQESTNLISLLKSDIDQSHGERSALHNSLKRLLGLFGESLRAATTLRSRISERVGLCLDHEGLLDAQQVPALDDTWLRSEPAMLDLDMTLPGNTEMSSVAELSSHVCESFLSPDNSLDWEQPVRRVFQSLDLAVDGLLGLALDSSRQLEEARQLHSHFEKEFKRKNEETAQVVQKHQELLQRLDEESSANSRLVLELHKAEGLIAGFQEEQAGLQEALSHKDSSEQALAEELESQREQLQQASRQVVALQDENSALRRQKEAVVAEAQDKEATLRAEVASLSQEQLETRKQCEKDRLTLLSQMKVLESELEEQLSRQQACAQQAEELTALRQQLESLDKHLRSQRQFMDEQAVEREHEREDFQQEIQRLEEQLQQMARPQPRSAQDSDQTQLGQEVELLQEKLREQSDGLNELALKKDLADQRVAMQEQEIRRLEEANAQSSKLVAQLQGELEQQRRTVRGLQQDQEALQEQQMKHLLLVSSLQSRLDDAKCPVPVTGGRLESIQEQLEEAQGVLQQRDNEVLDLKEQLEKIRADLASKDQEVLHLNVKESHAAARVQELQEENTRLMAVYDRSSEIEELKSIIENLRENQHQLQRDKAEEMEQLHEVIEKLQTELSRAGPEGQVSGNWAGSLQSELDGAAAHEALAGELQAALAAKEALSQLLAEQERGHGQALETLRQRLRDAEAAAATRLVELERSTALKEAEAQGLAARVRECEAKIAERELEIAGLSRSRWARSTQLQAILAAFAHFRGALERQVLAAPEETPELQRLRAQCVRLSRQLQQLNQRFLRCQKELGRQQLLWGACPHCGDSCSPAQSPETLGDQDPEQAVGCRLQSVAPRGPGCDPQRPVAADLHPDKALVAVADTSPLKQGDALSVLSICRQQMHPEQLSAKEMHLMAEGCPDVTVAPWKDEKEPVGDCLSRNVDLLSQVTQLQESLDQLVLSMDSRSPSTEASGSGVSDGEEAEGQRPPAISPASEVVWDLVTWLGPQGPTGGTGQWRDPPEDRAGSPQASSRHSPRKLSHVHSEGAEHLTKALRALDLSSWSSPELLRKDSTLELQPSLPLTPCMDLLSHYSLDASLRDRPSVSGSQTGWLRLLGPPGGSTPEESQPAVDRGSPADRQLQWTSVEKDVEDFIITSLDTQEKSCSSPPRLDRNGDGSEQRDSSGLAEMPLTHDPPRSPKLVPPPASRKSRRAPAAMKEKGVHPQHVKALLQMVCDESHQILALSEFQNTPGALSKGDPSVLLENFLREGQDLVDAAAALRGCQSLAHPEGEQEPPCLSLDWRGQCLQVVPEACEQQWATLRAPQVSSDACTPSALWEKLEKVVREQGSASQVSLEPSRPTERTRLLSEIQALRAQLRLTHLQNQEKLQQLCAALTGSEARGSQREHQLRRQVELLAYKVEQEKCIASDLQRTLTEEQEKASTIQKLLVAEQSVAKALKSELCECRQDNERLLQSLSDVQKEVLQLRRVLDGKEKELRAALTELESQRGLESALQSQLEEERQRHLHMEGQNTRSLEELKASLDKQFAQSNRLCVALKHEQTAKDNLQKELRIEASRCEALLAQERGRLTQLQQSLEAERGRSQELTEALQHERLLTEQLSRRAQEVCAHQETQAQQALLQKLEEEQARVRELQATLQKAQQQAVRTQQRLQAEVQRRCAELQREKERELELQCQRNEHKMKQLQRTVGELQAEGATQPGVQLERQGLERIRQQLLCAAGLLTSFINQTLDRTIHDWTSSNEKAVASLLCTLQELKSELTAPSPSPKKMTAGLHIQLVDILLSDNESLRKTLSTVAEEKAELCRAVSKLEKTLKHHLLKGCALSRSDKSARKLDKSALQSSSQHLEPGARVSGASEDTDSGSFKMEKLYLHYLRAESFRKALIYQKKYLLLLIGGFQDSEQETLSMIAHLGVFPSKADRRVVSRPFTKFRTAVRVVIAILRLRFLVKKWQEVGRKGALIPSRSSRPEFLMPQHQESPPESSESPPTRDVSSSHSRDSVPRAFLRRRERSSLSPNSRSERALTLSQDPEHSLTEYIHQLEMIQQRLGGVPSDSTSKKSFRQKIKQ